MRDTLYQLVKFLEPELDDLFTALGDPVRRSVVRSLAEGERTISDLAEPFEMTMAAVMKHIGVLERCGLVTSEKRGRTRYCRLEAARLTLAQEWLSDTAAFWTRRLEALERHLKETE